MTSTILTFDSSETHNTFEGHSCANCVENIGNNANSANIIPVGETQITKLYVGYFDRAPDSLGLKYWQGDLLNGVSLVDIATSFSSSPEYISMYGGLSYSNLIDKIYDNLFDRTPDVEGKQYWTTQLNSGVSSSRLIVDIISGAQGADKIRLENTTTVAGDWTSSNSTNAFSITNAQNAVNSIGENQGNGVNITFLNPQLLPYATILTTSLNAAWNQWGGHGMADIELNYIPLNNNTLAFAYARTELLTGNSTGLAFTNIPLTQTTLGNEISTGLDMNGDLPDGRITITYNLDQFTKLFDPTTILAHELGHIIGFRSSLFPFEPNTTTATTWDSFLSFPTGMNGRAFFNGPSAVDYYSGPIPITGFYNATHPDGIGSIMDPFFSAGQVKSVGVLDTLMMEDIGIFI